MPLTYTDPLLVCSTETCTTCGGDRKTRRKCGPCRGTGFLPAVGIRGLWRDSAAFLVCGGPSVNTIVTPANALTMRGVASLGVNLVAAHVPVRAWVFGDPQEKFHHGLFLDPAVMTFAPNGKLRRHIRAKLPDGTFRNLRRQVCECPNTWGFSRGSHFSAEDFLSSMSASWGHGGDEPHRPFSCLCTMLLGVRLLCYLGVRRIYCLGVDLAMTKDAPYAFKQSKSARNGRYSHEAEYLAQIQPTLNAAGITMANCNPDCAFPVLPHVPFAAALADCLGAVPREPWDLMDWYSKGVKARNLEAHPKAIRTGRLAREQNRERKTT